MENTTRVFPISNGMNNELMEQKKKFIITGVAVGVVLFAFLFVKTLEEIKGYGLIGKDVPPQSIITVSGKGEKMVTPDIAEFSFSVIREAKTVDNAQKEATQKMNEAIIIVRGAGVEEKDIKTTGYNIYPRYEYRKSATVCSERGCPPGNQILVGYEVSQSVSIKVRKISDAGSILSKIGEIGVSNVSGLTFSIDKEDEVKDEARSIAINDAQAQAKVLAKQLGVKLVRIVNFSESGNYPIYYAKTMALGVGGGDERAPSPELPPGENTVTSNVTIVYEIR